MRYVLETFIVPVLCVLTTLPVLAGDGAIPIWEPTTITEPGRYVLTRDITGTPTAAAINVRADDVELDLNGFAIRNAGGTAIIIRPEMNKNLSIRNGTIVAHTGVTAEPDWAWTIEIRDITFRCANGINLNSDLHNIIIDHNVIASDGLESAIFINAVSSCRITRNTIFGHSAYPHVYVACQNSMIRDNDLIGGGIELAALSEESHVIANKVSAAGYGLRIWSSYNHIEGNMLTDNDWGLSLDGSHSVYRGNTARGNQNADFIDNGVDNTTHGDNYLPNQM